MKEVGMLAPLFMIPNSYGIGDFSGSSRKFMDFLKRCGFRYWQILPLNPVGLGNSPYQSISSFAIDDIYVSLSDLKRKGLIDVVKPYDNDKRSSKINYTKVRHYKMRYFALAYKNYLKRKDAIKHLDNFLKREPHVDEYAQFVCLSKINGGKDWNKWEIKTLDKKRYARDYYYEVFKQYILYDQWTKLHAYAMMKHILIIGDLPFYVGHNSADVYFNQKCFLLDENGNPTSVAGVPPDYFSADGQMWGNPIYDWDYLKANDYKIIVERIVFTNRIYDYVRIDHFRAFDTYYMIPANAQSAREGNWKEAPGYEFFDYLFATHEDLHILAEDLGDMRDEVFYLRDHYQFPGMNVVQFSIIPEELEHKSLPFIYKRPISISYTGTHDNDTVLHWYTTLDENTKDALNNYLISRFGENDIVTNIIHYSLSEPAELSMISLVDALGLMNGRINTPGTLDPINWSFRIKDFRTLEKREDYLLNLIQPYWNI